MKETDRQGRGRKLDEGCMFERGRRERKEMEETRDVHLQLSPITRGLFVLQDQEYEV